MGSANPQIVRVRVVEGDVRVARGKVDEKETGDAWEQVVADMPLETGFNLVTGNGRAEVEFEDASTLYLDENSAISLDDLRTTDGIPHTEMTLLSGTATLHLHPSFPGEMYVLRTPTDRIRAWYPASMYMRVTSYLDAVAITRLQEPGAGVASKAMAATTVFHNNGKVVASDVTSNPTTFVAWDAWVADRVAQHTTAAVEAAEASGLPASTPGLADMDEQGVFFQCAPYGTCWEPTSDEQDQDSQIAPPSPVGQGPEFQPKLRPSSVGLYPGDTVTTRVSAVALMGFAEPVSFTALLPQGFTCVTDCSGQLLPGEQLPMKLQADPSVPIGVYKVAVTVFSGPLTHVVYLKIYVEAQDDDEYLPVVFADVDSFPCFPGSGPSLPAHSPRGFRYGGARRYAWGVCHAGTWIYRQHRYIWVVGEKKHHHPPCKPVKCERKVCFVPLHPRDVKGKLPVNWKHTIYRPIDKRGTQFEPLTLKPKDKVELMEETPKEFLELSPLALAKVDAPKIFAYDLNEQSSGGKAVGSGTELHFDHSTHSFLLAHVVEVGGKPKVTMETLEEHRQVARARVGGAAGHPVAGSKAGGATHASSGSHASSSHASSAHASSGSSHASAPAAHASSSASHH